MIHIGVVGIGAMGKNHARVCSELGYINLVGIYDKDIKKSTSVAKKLGTKCYTSYRELLNKIDALIIATPTETHYRIAIDALRNGKHVLIEKPISTSVKKAQLLVKKAEEENLRLITGQIERYNPAVQFVKDGMQKNKFGDVITISSKRVSRLYKRILDIGVILDIGIHDLDVMQYLAGEIESVYASAGKYNQNLNFEDHANILLNFSNGIKGMIEVNWLTPIKIRQLFLTCSEHYVAVDYIDQSVTISSSTFKKLNEMDLFHIPIQYSINKIALEKKEPLKIEISNFIDAIDKKEQALATGEDGLNALKIVQATIKSYKNNKVVKV